MSIAKGTATPSNSVGDYALFERHEAKIRAIRAQAVTPRAKPSWDFAEKS